MNYMNVQSQVKNQEISPEVCNDENHYRFLFLTKFAFYMGHSDHTAYTAHVTYNSNRPAQATTSLKYYCSLIGRAPAYEYA